MKWLAILIVSGLAIFGLVRASSHKTQEKNKSFDSFALLELFTSEGCSSCPPADRLLPQLASENAGVIPLSFHVDYWNNLGWKDPFSQGEFTDRQKQYARQLKLESIYTPQLIINGQYELVGSNKLGAEGNIQKLLKQNAPVKIIVDQVKKENNQLSVTCHLVGDWQNSDLIAAVVQKHAETYVKAGENHGARLSHTNVVREFLHNKAAEKMNFEIPIPGAVEDKWQLILFTQRENNLMITGASVYDP